MKKNVLAPGDSTVVEVSFKSGRYRSSVRKGATITTNDPKRSQIRINLLAKVTSGPDTTLPFLYAPSKLEFTQDGRVRRVRVEDYEVPELHFTTVGDVPEDLDLRYRPKAIKQGKSGDIEFEWKGVFEKENIKTSVTFLALGSDTTRFSIPIVVAGTNPTPVKREFKKRIKK